MKIGRITAPFRETVVTLEEIELDTNELSIIERLIKPEQPSTPVTVRATTIDCEHSNSCTDRWSEKCARCANNKAQSYFKEKEVRE